MTIRAHAEVFVDRGLTDEGRKHVGEHDLLVVVLGQLAGLGVAVALIHEIVVDGHERGRDLRENLVLVVARLDQYC